jgi:hypothetical protein
MVFSAKGIFCSQKETKKRKGCHLCRVRRKGDFFVVKDSEVLDGN